MAVSAATRDEQLTRVSAEFLPGALVVDESMIGSTTSTHARVIFYHMLEMATGLAIPIHGFFDLEELATSIPSIAPTYSELITREILTSMPVRPGRVTTEITESQTMIDDRLKILIDRFANEGPGTVPVSTPIVNAVKDFVGWLARHRREIVGTVTDDGILVLEANLESGVQLFVEVDSDGRLEATIFEPGTGVRGLEVAAVSDLTADLMESLIGGT